MNIIKAYTSGLKASLRKPKMIFLIYTVNLVLGLSLAIPFLFSFQDAIGNSLSAENLKKCLDYATVSELVHFNSWNISSLFSQLKWTGFLYWILSVFFAGGILRIFNKEEYTVSSFFSGAGVNFFRFLGLDALMIVAQIAAAAIIYGSAYWIISDLFDNLISEKPVFLVLGLAAFFHILVVMLLMMIADYGKCYLELNGGIRIFKAIGKAINFVFSNFVKTYFLYFMLFVGPVLVLIAYKLTLDKIGMITVSGIIIMFFVKQIFVVFNVWFRMWSLASQFEMYADDYVYENTIILKDVKTETSKIAETEIVKEVVTTTISQPQTADEIKTQTDEVLNESKTQTVSEVKTAEVEQVITQSESKPTESQPAEVKTADVDQDTTQLESKPTESQPAEVKTADVEQVITQTTVTTTETTVETSENVTSSESTPQTVIYTEEEMKKIAAQQLIDAGLEPDTDLTEIVSDNTEDGEPTGIAKAEDEFSSPADESDEEEVFG